MDDPRKWGKDHIGESLKQINSETWLVGGLVIRRSPNPSDVATWNDDSDNSSYTLTVAPTPPLSATTPPDSPHIELVYKNGDCAIWSIGNNVLCKARYFMKGITPESVTLNFVRDQQPSFETPKVIHHAFAGDRSFLFFQRLPGRTLKAAWPSLDEYWRRQYLKAIANAVKEMAEWKGHVIGSVDGQNITEYYLSTFKRKGNKVEGPEEFLSAKFQATFELMGMDCSNLVFSNLTLGPESIIVEDEPKSGKIGISDFEGSGYFPRGWIRTKYRVSADISLPPEVPDAQDWLTWLGTKYRFSPAMSLRPEVWLKTELSEELGANGFEDFAAAWGKWFRSCDYEPSFKNR